MQPKNNQFFLPFNGYKVSDTPNPTSKGNLSNMKTHTSLNISNDKTRQYLKNQKDDMTNLEAKFHRNTVQSKLKKLIGSSSKQQDRNESSSSNNKNQLKIKNMHSSQNYKISDKLNNINNTGQGHNLSREMKKPIEKKVNKNISGDSGNK